MCHPALIQHSSESLGPGGQTPGCQNLTFCCVFLCFRRCASCTTSCRRWPTRRPSAYWPSSASRGKNTVVIASFELFFSVPFLWNVSSVWYACAQTVLCSVLLVCVLVFFQTRQASFCLHLSRQHNVSCIGLNCILQQYALIKTQRSKPWNKHNLKISCFDRQEFSSQKPKLLQFFSARQCLCSWCRSVHCQTWQTLFHWLLFEIARLAGWWWFVIGACSRSWGGNQH